MYVLLVDKATTQSSPQKYFQDLTVSLILKGCTDYQMIKTEEILHITASLNIKIFFQLSSAITGIIFITK